MLRNSLSGHRRRPATSQQRSGGLYFLALNQYFIRDKTIPAGQNADFGGFLRSKAVSTGRFSSSAIKCRRCRRRSVPARSGAAQFALRAPSLTCHQSAALRWALSLSSTIWISSGIKRFLPDKMLILVVSSGQRPVLPDVFWFGARSLVFSSVAPPVARVPSKGSLSLILPSRAGPLRIPLTGPRTAMPFDRHTCHWLFAPLISDANIMV